MSAKIIMIGESGAGKTTLVKKFSDLTLGRRDTAAESQPTIAVDFSSVKIDLDGKNVELKIWDTAGSERFQTITSNYFRGVQGVVLVFDCTDYRSFERLSNWLTQVANNAPQNVQKMIVCNKCDLMDSRKVDGTVSEQFATKEGALYMETSGLSGMNVSEMFASLSRAIVERVGLCTADATVSLNSTANNTKQASSCC
eukprot:TRINITY_DN6546_c0_g1_i2.p1 TRINITY_DN6546_c0_g1~~TRINITY_DN6546_c0_g1_i2.p1  ORF type:complete len:198 (+),score=31.29 TRINITY_DN6546_c0_g1_i2:46-639(+)